MKRSLSGSNVGLAICMFLLSLAGACATTIRARSDFDRSHDFSGYRTFAWIDDDPMVAPSGSDVRVSPLNRRRIVEAIEKELRAKGFELTHDRAAADFVVAYTVGARDRIDADSYPVPYRGRWRWGGPYFGSDVDVDTYTEGTLAIDIFDGKSRQPVWHGWATRRVRESDAEQAAALIEEAVRRVLADFPPQSVS